MKEESRRSSSQSLPDRFNWRLFCINLTSDQFSDRRNWPVVLRPLSFLLFLSLFGVHFPGRPCILVESALSHQNRPSVEHAFRHMYIGNRTRLRFATLRGGGDQKHSEDDCTRSDMPSAERDIIYVAPKQKWQVVTVSFSCASYG
jgi:hypothetical protein